MNWQPTPPPPGPVPLRPAAMRWAAAAITVCLLLAGAVVLHRSVLARFFGGAASPQEAVTAAVTAIEGGDLRALALLLPPEETAGLGEVATQVQRIWSALGEQGGPSGHPAGTGGLHVTVRNLTLKSHDEQHRLTKVAIESADITASFDPAAATGPLRTYLENNRGTERDATITVRGASVTTNGRSRTLRIGGHEQAPFVMTVERDGSWYVSPLFSYFQYLSEEKGQPTSPAVTTPGFGSPIEAAEGYLSALANSLNSRDISGFARATGGMEGRLLQTYRGLINTELGELDKDGFAVHISKQRFRLLSANPNVARVRPENLRLNTSFDGKATSTDFDGECLRVDSPRHRQRFCLGDKSAVGVLAPLIRRLDYLVAVRTGGDWKVSATRTLFTMVADALGWIGAEEIPIIKALLRRDPTELTKGAKVAGTIRLDSTGTITIDAVGPYLDGGYAVVAIPDPGGKRFTVSCRDKSFGCRVVTVVTPSGRAEGRHSGGRGGEAGDYRAVVMAVTGDVEVTVRSR